MNFKDKFNFIKNGTDKNNEIKDIINTLPENLSVANELLNDINNINVKVVLDEDIKNSYYVYLQNTIYLSNKPKNQKQYGRILLIAHECIHSIQSKMLQKFNFIFSNIELLLFAIVLILGLFNVNILYLLYVYLGITLISATFRLILEFDAVKNSIPLAQKYMARKLNNDKTNLIINIYKFQINITYPFFILSLLFGKIFRIILLVLLIILK